MSVHKYRTDSGITNPDGTQFSTQATTLFVVGQPVHHSLSPIMHNAALNYHKINHNFLALDVAPESLEKLKGFTDSLNVKGMSVTYPLKAEAFNVCDTHTPDAKLLGNVNCIKVENNVWHGHNTDVGGLKLIIEKIGDINSELVIMGTGNTAKSALVALDRLNYKQVEVRYHTNNSAKRLEDWLRYSGLSIGVDFFSLDQSTDNAGKLIINCLSSVDVCDLIAPGNFILLNLDYSNQRNKIECGLFLPGTVLLLEQGALAFEFWYGIAAPYVQMQKSLGIVLPE